MVSLYFCIGWMTYTSVPYLLKANHYFRYFILGHLFLFLVLSLLAVSIEKQWAVIILWILTGFGGGTVFCIEKINQSTLMQSKKDIVFSENVGHILGVLTGLLVYYAGGGRIAYVLYFSALLALAAMLLILRFQMNNPAASSEVSLSETNCPTAKPLCIVKKLLCLTYARFPSTQLFHSKLWRLL